MGSEDSDTDSETQRRFDELSARVAANRADIDALQARAEAANQRADVSEARADASEARADDDRGRIHSLEGRADVDAQLIAALQAEGVVSQQLAGHMEVALRSSRKIGAAIGILMANRRFSEEQAFETLVRGSNQTNRKLRDIADDVVRTGDASDLPAS